MAATCLHIFASTYQAAVISYLKHEAKASFQLSTDMFITYATYTVPLPYLYLLDLLAKTHSLIGRTRLHPTAGCLPTGYAAVKVGGFHYRCG